MSELPPSPLAPTTFPDLPPVGGVQLATFAAGLRYQNRADLMLAVLDPGTTVAGTFTSSLCPSAPVDWCRRHISSGRARAVVCNSGNANAFTGKAGATSAELTAVTIAQELSLKPEEVLLASTGVIGETLANDALAASLGPLRRNLRDSAPESFEAAANAIRTTDTFAKGASRTTEIGSHTVTIVGIAKGSGMIAPDMATMLSFLFTDAAIDAKVLQSMLTTSVNQSYNRITVDSDTSTSDTTLLFATGTCGVPPIQDLASSEAHQFQEALDAVNLDLAHQIVRDGEGATKFVEVVVTGAESNNAAEIIAFSIANSPLVKTAIAAEDANWGRIVMAVGKAGQRADRDRLDIWIGPEQCAKGGVVAPGYSEAAATEHLRQSEIRLGVDVGISSGLANGRATVWTCDLTHGYIDINAGYRS